VVITIAPHGSAERHPHAKADQGHRRLVVVVMVFNVNDRWIIGRHIDHFRAGRLHLDDRVRHIDNLVFVGSLHDGVGDGHHLLRRRLECAGGLRFAAQRLNGIHEFHWLFQESLAQRGCPRQVCVHFGHYFREPGELLDFIIPRLLVHFGKIVRVLQEARRHHHFQRKDGSWQNNSDQRVGIKRDGRRQLLQVGLTALSRRRRRWNRSCGRCCGRCCGRSGGGSRGHHCRRGRVGHLVNGLPLNDDGNRRAPNERHAQPTTANSWFQALPAALPVY
jgi:hypothetical protein